MKEVWKDISGFEKKYQVSTLGRVRSLFFYSEIIIPNKRTHLRPHPERVLIPREHTGGYLRVQINGKDYYIHRLVADAFLPVDESRPEVNHIDSNKKNNNLSNLERCNRSENLKHGYRVGHRKNPGAGKFGALNLNAKAVVAISKQGISIEFGSISEMARHFNRNKSSVQDAIARGHRCAGHKVLFK